MCRKKMTIDLPFFMGRSRGMKSPYISVTTDERRTFAPFFCATRDGAVTSVGISQGADSVFASVEVEKSMVLGDDETTEKLGRICFVAEIEKATECCASVIAAIAALKIRILYDYNVTPLFYTVSELTLCNANSEFCSLYGHISTCTNRPLRTSECVMLCSMTVQCECGGEFLDFDRRRNY